MTEINKQVFCSCFGCDKNILVGDKVHTLSYQYEEIEAINIVAPITAESLGAWCDECFSKLRKNKNYRIPWEYIPDQVD